LSLGSQKSRQRGDSKTQAKRANITSWRTAGRWPLAAGARLPVASLAAAVHASCCFWLGGLTTHPRRRRRPGRSSAKEGGQQTSDDSSCVSAALCHGTTSPHCRYAGGYSVFCEHSTYHHSQAEPGCRIARGSSGCAVWGPWIVVARETGRNMVPGLLPAGSGEVSTSLESARRATTRMQPRTSHGRPPHNHRPTSMPFFCLP
jgi:hypothetical protein